MIYIPIWIDLKVGLQRQIRSRILNLHSNMDRFEMGLVLVIPEFEKIYIPIWIDLKR